MARTPNLEEPKEETTEEKQPEVVYLTFEQAILTRLDQLEELIRELKK